MPVPRSQSNQAANRQKTLQSDRNLAKTGMAVSLGALVITGLMRTPQTRTLHFVAGAALVGFSVWHASLYNSNNKR